MPVHELLGTLLYFAAQYFAHTAATSKCCAFERGHRVWLLRWALDVTDSWQLHPTTKRNFVATYESLEFSLCDGALINPGRDATAMLEYFIGLMRVHQNQDHMTIQAGHYIAQRIEQFHKLCTEHGYRLGSQTRYER